MDFDKWNGLLQFEFRIVYRSWRLMSLPLGFINEATEFLCAVMVFVCVILVELALIVQIVLRPRHGVNPCLLLDTGGHRCFLQF